MKRAGFTMIELIFVIVIIGVLSAVALPKFIGISDQAHLAKVKAYVGTFNRTIAPALWAQAVDDNNGSVKNILDSNLTQQLPTPTEITLTTNALNTCSNTAALVVGSVVSTAGGFATAKIGTQTYTIGCVDGNTTSAPSIWLADANKKVIVN